MKIFFKIVIIFVITISCSIFPQKGTNWPSSFYRIKSNCDAAKQGQCSNNNSDENTQKTNYLFLLKSGQYVTELDTQKKDK